MARNTPDPLEMEIERALAPGDFIKYRACYGFVARLRRVEEKLAALVHQREGERAAALYEAVASEEPEMEAPYEGLVRVYSLERDGERLVDVLRRQARYSAAGARRADLHLRRAQVAYAWLADPDTAAGAYEDALAEPSASMSTSDTAFGGTVTCKASRCQPPVRTP